MKWRDAGWNESRPGLFLFASKKEASEKDILCNDESDIHIQVYVFSLIMFIVYLMINTNK